MGPDNRYMYALWYTGIWTTFNQRRLKAILDVFDTFDSLVQAERQDPWTSCSYIVPRHQNIQTYFIETLF